MQTVAKIAAKERVGLWVPVSMAQYSVYEALACSLMPPNTTCCTTDPHMTVEDSPPPGLGRKWTPPG